MGPTVWFVMLELWIALLEDAALREAYVPEMAAHMMQPSVLLERLERR